MKEPQSPGLVILQCVCFMFVLPISVMAAGMGLQELAPAAFGHNPEPQAVCWRDVSGVFCD